MTLRSAAVARRLSSWNWALATCETVTPCKGLPEMPMAPATHSNVSRWPSVRLSTVLAWWACWRQGLADGPLARLGVGALAPEGTPHPIGDIHLEVAGSAERAQEGMITAGVIGAAVRFELVEVLKDVEGHR